MNLYFTSSTQETLYLLETHSTSNTLFDGVSCTEAQAYTADIIYHFDLFLKRQSESTLKKLPYILFQKNPYITLIIEVTNPAAYLGELTHNFKSHPIHIVIYELYQKAQQIFTFEKGELTSIKNHSDFIFCAFIRHGKTTGNLSKRYIGRTNEPLCKQGIDHLLELKNKNFYPTSQIFYVSPMLRCVETAQLLYPDASFTFCQALRECDFGEFENKNYLELKSNTDYQKWVDSSGTLPFPNGENPKDFTLRSVQGFLQCVNQQVALQSANHFPYTHSSPWITFIVHGGTIMSVLSELAFPKGDYFSFQVNNGLGYLCEYQFSTQTLTVLYPIS